MPGLPIGLGTVFYLASSLVMSLFAALRPREKRDTVSWALVRRLALIASGMGLGVLVVMRLLLLISEITGTHIRWSLPLVLIVLALAGVVLAGPSVLSVLEICSEGVAALAAKIWTIYPSGFQRLALALLLALISILIAYNIPQHAPFVLAQF